MSKSKLFGMSDEHISAFRIMCRHNGWEPKEVLSYLLEYAVQQNINLALPLHLRRVRLKAGVKWENPYKQQ